MAVLRQQCGLVGRLDIGGGLGLEDLVGAAADDMVAGEAGEALERLVGEDIAAIVDALGGNADRHIVEHRFEELLGRAQFPRQLALVGGILMGCNRAAVRQTEIPDQDRPAVGQIADQALRALGTRVELLDAAIERAARASQRQQFPAGHAGRQFGALQAVDFEVTVVAIDDPLLRIGHDHAMAQAVQRRADIGGAAHLRALDPAQRRVHPQRDRGDEGGNNDDADQDFPEHVRIERTDIARRRELVRQRESRRARQSERGKADRDPRKNQILAACLPILVSHQSPAEFSSGVSGGPGLDRVNAYPHPPKMRLNLWQLP